jgi:drug/metabolite transporter (DMT)-like permease
VICIFYFYRSQKDKSKLVPDSTEILLVLVYRGVSAGVGIILYYSVIALLPLSTFLVLRNLKSIFVLVISCFVGKDKITVLQTILVIMSFIGTILVIQPSLILFLIMSTEDLHQEQDSNFVAYCLLALIPVLLKALVNVIIRKYCKYSNKLREFLYIRMVYHFVWEVVSQSISTQFYLQKTKRLMDSNLPRFHLHVMSLPLHSVGLQLNVNHIET